MFKINSFLNLARFSATITCMESILDFLLCSIRDFRRRRKEYFEYDLIVFFLKKKKHCIFLITCNMDQRGGREEGRRANLILSR